MTSLSKLFAAVFAASFIVAVSPASALITRVWVSGKGADALTCGAVTSPCRTFQYVHDNIIAAGGEIDVLDPAGYGAIVITKSISIVNDGIGAVGVPAPPNGTAITINAGASDKIFLKGLTVSGFGTGAYGVRFTGGRALSITNCVFRNLSTGVYAEVTPATITISQTTASDNGFGFWFTTQGSGLNAALTDVDANNNTYGVYIYNAFVMLEHVTVNGNQYGIFNVGTAYLSHVVATGNIYGLYASTTAYTYGDNHMRGNSNLDQYGQIRQTDGN